MSEARISRRAALAGGFALAMTTGLRPALAAPMLTFDDLYGSVGVLGLRLLWLASRTRRTISASPLG